MRSLLSSRAFLASALCCAMLWPSGAALAIPFSEFVDPNPAPGNQFGATVVVLSTGKVVITSPFDDAGGVDAGAAYLFDGSTGALISTLVGSSASDNVGRQGVRALANGNYVVISPNWDNGAIVNAGATTWGSGTTGVSGVVSAANSLIGSTATDQVGGVIALANGNYVVVCPSCDNGAATDAGAATWGSGTTGVSGVVSAANSLVGSTAFDNVGIGGVTALSNGNYVVVSSIWAHGAAANAGATTWGSGTTGVSGVVSAANSLVGSAASDNVGDTGVIALSNGNYVVLSSVWDNGAVVDAGAATWGNGITGVIGAVKAANSLVGSTPADYVGRFGATALANGNYVVRSPNWHNGGIVDAGAATWGDGAAGLVGVVSAANSLVGSTTGDLIGDYGLISLSNGNYVVLSQYWDNGAAAEAGAATWGSGTTGVSGPVSAANSLVGSTTNDVVGTSDVTLLSNGNYVVSSVEWDGLVADAGAVTWGSGTSGVSGVISAANSLVGSTTNDLVGLGGVTALSNGNYVVLSQQWDNGAIAEAGAATWGNGTTGVTGAISAANSLIGSTAGNSVGTAVTALTNGNYVVRSLSWDNGAIVNVGAVTWGNGTTGVTGPVSAANSLVGSTANDQVGNSAITALSNGHYVVRSTNWDNGAIVNAGATTWGNGTTGVTGVISAANSLVGSTANDNVGSSGVTALANGNYVVRSQNWDNGAAINAGAATWGNGTTGVTGPVSAANSLVGSTASDFVGSTAVTAIANGNYVVPSVTWDNGALVNACAATWADGMTGVTGPVSAANSLIGTTANTNLQPIVVNQVNGTVIARFLAEGGGRVRVGPPDGPVIAVGPESDGSPVGFALEGVHPNPASGKGLHVAFALPSGAAARLELLDVGGRRVRAREVGSLGAGRHSVNLTEGRRVAPGLYWVRLTQGPYRRTTRVAVID